MKASLQMVQPPTGKDNYSEACKELRILRKGLFLLWRGWIGRRSGWSSRLRFRRLRLDPLQNRS